VPAAAVSARGLTKHFGDVHAVDELELEIADGEFFSMLGPSGSGKTTVLRLIAGFESPTSGRVLLGEDDVTDLPPHRRDVNTVFQDYAIFPHMDVLTNVEYGLRVKKVERKERRRRAEEALAAGSDSGSPWPGPWSTGPRCCSSTNRSVPWTSSCAARCSSS
jgi:putative spermidine/putrescine transport system ATP-binding protein